jgi:hypothetical protein
MPVISDSSLRMMRELSGPNFNASVGKGMPANRFRTSGNASIHRFTSEWSNAAIR